jgi:undecaprenyl-diphosphatase
MDNLFIFGAEKLFLLSPVIALYFFYKLPRESQKQVVIFAFFSLPLAYILAAGAREVFYNPRPFVVGGFAPLIYHAPDNGFPSDHVLLLAAIASIITLFNRRFAISLWAITILVGISRMYAGVHHLIDVAGSILIAILSSLIVYATIRVWSKSSQINS